MDPNKTPTGRQAPTFQFPPPPSQDPHTGPGGVKGETGDGHNTEPKTSAFRGFAVAIGSKLGHQRSRSTSSSRTRTDSFGTKHRKRLSFSFGRNKPCSGGSSDLKLPAEQLELKRIDDCRSPPPIPSPKPIEPTVFQIRSSQSHSNGQVGPSTSQALAVNALQEAQAQACVPDYFEEAITAANMPLAKLQAVNFVLKGLSFFAPPLAINACDIVLSLAALVENVSASKVSCLRLVQRSATVVCAVQQSIIDHKGRVSDVMERNLITLVTQLRDSEALLTKLAKRSFLKSYLHLYHTHGAIDDAERNLNDAVRVFQIQADLDCCFWRQQNVDDRETDMKIMMSQLREVYKTQDKILALLNLADGSRTEAVVSLQRIQGALLDLRSELANKPRTRRNQSRGAISYTQDRKSHRSLKAVINYPVDLLPSVYSDWEGDDDETRTARSRVEQRKLVQDDSPEQRSSDAVGYDDEIDVHILFVEAALKALGTSRTEVPDWTITQCEIIHKRVIARTSFATVWEGQHSSGPVAIKEISEINKKLFINEVDIWRKLRHQFVLPLLGASSTTASPPWHLISPFMSNGDLRSWIAGNGTQCNREKLCHEIAQGMEYLHSRDVLHGDLKSANVLISEYGTPQICDFGFSIFKVEITRSQSSKSSSGGSLPQAALHIPNGTLRWQAPELLACGPISKRSDVYAFAMTMFEIYAGCVPFAPLDERLVMDYVFHNILRPARPELASDAVWGIIQKSWEHDASSRPDFTILVRALSATYEMTGQVPISGYHETEDSFHTAEESQDDLDDFELSPTPRQEITSFYSSESESIHTVHSSNTFDWSEADKTDRADRQYRHHLVHGFDDRLKIPLFYPAPVSLGSVGYVRHGVFVQLFSASHGPSLQDMTAPASRPPVVFLNEYSQSRVTSTKINSRTLKQRSSQLISNATRFMRPDGSEASERVAYTCSHTLRIGSQAALIVDDARFEMYDSMDAARGYLISNIEWIIATYGDKHEIQRKDVIIVVGTMSASNWAFVVSEYQPGTTLTFNAFADRHVGQPWGAWTVNEPPQGDLTWVSRVSEVREATNPMKDCVLLARLKFPDNSMASTPVLHLNREIPDTQ